MGKTALILIFILGAALRFVFLDRMSFWTDELQTLEYANPVKSNGEIIYQNLTFPDQSPPLFTLLLHGWMKITPSETGVYPSETWIRFLPALVSLFSLIFLIRIFILPWQGLISLGLFLVFCFSSFYLYFSREVRPYGFLLFMALLSAWAFLNLLKRDRRSDCIIYSLSILCGVLTNPFMWLIFISHCVYLLVSRDRKRLHRIIKLAIPSIAIYLPYAFIILRQFRIYERPPLFCFFVAKKIAGLFFHLTLGFNFPTNVVPRQYGIFLENPLFLLSLAIILLAGTLSLIKWPRICKIDTLAFLSLVHVIVPVIAVLFIYPRRLGPRTMVIIAPFFHYLLVKGIFFRPQLQLARATSIIFLTLTLFFGFRFIAFNINPYIPEDWRRMAGEIRMKDRPDSIFLMNDMDNLLLRYYFYKFEQAHIITYDAGEANNAWPALKSSIDGSGCSKIILLRKLISPYSSLNRSHSADRIFQNLRTQFKLEEVQWFGERLSLCIFTPLESPVF